MRVLKHRVVDVKELKANLTTGELLAFDVETKGFYGAVLLAQFYQTGWDEVLMLRHPDITTLVGVLANQHIVCHNTCYEVSTIQRQLGVWAGKPNVYWRPHKWEDTLLLSKVRYFKKEKFSLDMCYQYLLGYDPYEVHDLDKKQMQKSDFTDPTEDQYTYAAIDVFWLLELYEDCKSLTDSQWYKLDKVATNHAFKFQCSGLGIDEDKIHTRIAEIQAKVDTNTARIEKLAGKPINVNSWQQVRPFINQNESDGYHLALFAIRDGCVRSGLVKENRTLIKRISFANKFLTTAVAGRIYGLFGFNTKSGRGQCKDQNLQQIPRALKDVFCAPKGRVLVMSDFSQLELRYVCAHTGDEAMANMFKAGIDIHNYVSDMMTIERQYAKTCNFNLVYMGSANMLQSIFLTQGDTWIELKVVNKLKSGWVKLWGGLAKWHKDTMKAWKAKKPFYTILGRKMSAKLYTDAANLPIQGSSAEVAKLALHKMNVAVNERPHLVQANVIFVNFVHDSFMWECDDNPEIYKEVAELTAKAMQDAWNDLVKFTKVPDLPMPVDVQVGYNWGDTEYGVVPPIYELKVEG